MRLRLLLLCVAALVGFSTGQAEADEAEFKIGVVASVTGPFAAPTKDTFDGFNAWMKVHGLPGKKIVPERIRENRAPYYAALKAADVAWGKGDFGIEPLADYLSGLLKQQLADA